jgi:LmbE family N-acetylglucosaminyl deacetylase
MKTLVLAPHPDDEILGAGGTMLRRKEEGASTAWLIGTRISTEAGWSSTKVAQREQEISRVADLMGFDEVHRMDFETTQLDRVPMADLVSAISSVFKQFEPTEVLLPHRGDVHSDHDALFTAAASCTKWFRYPSVKRVMAYETISETDFGLRRETAFSPNVFVDISRHLDAKLAAMNVYASEVGAFPFPRSMEAIRALATVRGASSGFMAAEAFELLVERQ